MKLDSLENRTFPSLQKKNPYSNVVKEKLITRNQQNSLRLLQKTKKKILSFEKTRISLQKGTV